MENQNIYELEDRNYRSAILSAIRGDNTDEVLREILADYHDNDIAAVLDELTPEERDRLFEVLGNEATSDIIAHLDDAGEILSELDADEAADIIEQMDADDALEALENVVNQTCVNC